MKLRVSSTRNSPNLPALERVLAQFQGRGTVRLETALGSDFLTAQKKNRRGPKELRMPVPAAWLECPEKSPYLERVAEMFCRRALGL